MKILQVVHGFAPECIGGTENYVLEATMALRAAGHDVSVLTGSLESRDIAEIVASEHGEIPVRRLHRAGLYLDSWEKSYDPMAATLFAQVLDEIRPEVVHVHHWIRLTRNLVEIAAGRGIPSVVTLHDAMVSCARVFRVRPEDDGGSEQRRGRLGAREAGLQLCDRPLSVASCLTCVPRAEMMNDADCSEEIDAYRVDFEHELQLASAIIVPSRAHQDLLSRNLGRPASAFRVVPHGALVRGRPQRVERQPPGDPIRLAHWGHLEPYKGYHVILEALHRLTAEERKRFEVVVFGTASDPEYRARLDTLSQGLAVRETGAFAPPDLANVPFDVAVIPSLASESFSFVLDEAIELGVPALVSDRGALPERIGGGGATFTAGSAGALAARLREILADPSIIDRWAGALPALGSMNDHAAHLLRIYRGAVRHGRDPLPVDPAVTAARLVRIARRLEERTSALARADAMLADRDARLRGKESDLEGFDRSLADHRRIIAEKDEALARYAASVVEHKAMVAARESTVAEFTRSIDEHKKEIARRDAHLRSLEGALAEQKKEAGLKSSDLAEAAKAAVRLREGVAGLEKEIRARDAAIAALEASVVEHERRLQGFRAAQAKDVADARRAAERQASEMEDLDRRLAAARDEARSAAMEVAGIQGAAAVAKSSQARAEADAAALDIARAEEQRQIASWRNRAFRAEAAVSAVSATLDATGDALAGARREAEDAALRAERLEGDLGRVDDLSQRAAAALALGDGGGRSGVERVADVVAGVVAQQASLARLRSWLEGQNGTTRAKDVSRRLDAMPRPLRVLMMIHDFLPYHAAGSEIYTFQLAKALSTRHSVELVFCENRPERPQYETRRGTFEGLPFTEIVHHAAFPDFRDTWRDPRMEERFDAILDRFEPDVLHVQHSKFFGVGVLARAARRNIPIVYTLHEYMLLCARDGQMLQASLERCELPDVATCAACMSGRIVESRAVAAGVQKVGRGLSRVLPGGLKEIGSRIERRAAVRHASAVAPDRAVELMAMRERETRAALAHVALFLAPSVFLRNTFVRAGYVPPEKVVVSRYGQDLTRFRDGRKARSDFLRVGYLGTVAEYKGVAVLVDALNRLAAYPVEGRIHGVTEFFPGFVKQLEESITNPRVRLLGRYVNQDVGRILAGIDVLVVPSLWWENSPITIHEAFLAGVPVVASDQGGMAELVEDGVNGFLFKIGDAADLARVLMRFVADPSLVERLRPRRASIRDIVEDALWTEGEYRRLLSARANA